MNQQNPKKEGGAGASVKAVSSVHPWHKLPRWKKRIHGWLCYQVQSWFALLWPEAADRIMYKTLDDQFRKLDSAIGVKNDSGAGE